MEECSVVNDPIGSWVGHFFFFQYVITGIPDNTLPGIIGSLSEAILLLPRINSSKLVFF